MLSDMKMKFVLFVAAVAAVVASCSAPAGELVGVSKAGDFREANPYGMVFIRKGAFMMGANTQSAVFEQPDNIRMQTVEAFWMDETEITNAKYKQFVLWVRDSIIRERLADPAYGGDEEFKIEEDKEGNPITPHLNWKKPIPWRNPSEDEQRAIASVYRYNPISGVWELDPTQMNYRYEIYNLTAAAKRKNRLDPATRVYNTDVPVNDEMPMISKDTAFINDNGDIVRETVTRRLTGNYDFLNTYIVNVYPDTTAWINDFDNAYNEPYTRMYFSHPGYADYPVVGVSWEQANAFANWRTDYLRRSIGKQGAYIEPYRLPTEAEWEFAARVGKEANKYPWEGDFPISDSGCFYANLKPGDGNYIKDGNLITSKVGTYDPNDFGLYDMAGNVSEWTSTAYTESIDRLTNDINPEYRYNAAKEDPYKAKRKIVRGGSWKDIAHNVRADLRMWEYQNEQRSYIGFRCVRTQVGFAKGRKKK